MRKNDGVQFGNFSQNGNFAQSPRSKHSQFFQEEFYASVFENICFYLLSKSLLYALFCGVSLDGFHG